MPAQPKPPRNHLGVALRAHRESEGLSGDAVAETIGTERGNYYRLERGTHAPSYPTAVKLAAWLGWTTDEVMAAAARPAPSAEDSTQRTGE